MSSIKLLNGALDTEVLNPPTAANYPCLKNFFKMNEAADGSYAVGSNLKFIYDSISGVSIISNGAGGDIYFTAGDGTKLSSFAPGVPAGVSANLSYEDKNTVLMVLGTRAANHMCQLGMMTLNGTASESAADDGTNAPNTDSGLSGTGTDEMHALALDIAASGNTGIEITKVSATTSTVVTNVKAGVSADVDGSVYNAADMLVTGYTDIYGIAVFQFTDMPSTNEIALAALWMRERWLTGEKVIYPGWKGRD